MPLDLPVPGIGEQTPNFTLREADGQSVQLRGLRGQLVVLIFYRGEW